MEGGAGRSTQNVNLGKVYMGLQPNQYVSYNPIKSCTGIVSMLWYVLYLFCWVTIYYM